MYIFFTLNSIRLSNFFLHGFSVTRLSSVLLGTILIAIGLGATNVMAQDGVNRCHMCVQFNDSATYTYYLGQTKIGGSDYKKLTALKVAFEKNENVKISVESSGDGMTLAKLVDTMQRTDLVCDGISLIVDGFVFYSPTGIIAPPWGSGGGTLCIGTVTTVDEFRERPYKKFFDAEKKVVLERISGIEQLASKDAVRTTIKELLENDLKTQRAAMVSEVASEAVRLLEQPGTKKK